MLDEGELEALAADIAANGLQQAIVLDTDGAILDGRNRFRACELADVTPQYRVYEGVDPVGFVVSANLRRRHLSESQRAMIGARLANLGHGQKRADVPIGLSQPEAAQMLNVSERSVKRAHQVQEHAIPEVVQAVERGELAVSAAAAIARQEPEQQQESLANRTAHVSHNSGNNEWYTPAPYIEAAQKVLGAIDLDPASTEVANGVVGADRFYSEDDDGLGQEWHGRVWMNPPYAQPAIGRFCTKLATAYGSGAVAEACVLVNNATETAWFQELASQASAICFPRGRVKFWNPEKESAPLQGQAVLYLGKNPSGFLEAFRGFGFVAVLS
jgi:phage N-6-adenine-methyltransferase